MVASNPQTIVNTSSVEGLRAVILSSRDGAIILHFAADDNIESTSRQQQQIKDVGAVVDETGAAGQGDSQHHAEDPRVYRALATVFSVGADQAARIGTLGRLQQVLSFYDGGLILQVSLSQGQGVMTCHGSLSTNIGDVLDMLPTLKAVVEPLCELSAASVSRRIPSAADGLSVVEGQYQI